VRIPADKASVATEIGVTAATLEVRKRARMSGMNIVEVPLSTKRYILAR
jgi:hypothetical protein